MSRRIRAASGYGRCISFVRKSDTLRLRTPHWIRSLPSRPFVTSYLLAISPWLRASARQQSAGIQRPPDTFARYRSRSSSVSRNAIGLPNRLPGFCSANFLPRMRGHRPVFTAIVDRCARFPRGRRPRGFQRGNPFGTRYFTGHVVTRKHTCRASAALENTPSSPRPVTFRATSGQLPAMFRSVATLGALDRSTSGHYPVNYRSQCGQPDARAPITHKVKNTRKKLRRVEAVPDCPGAVHRVAALPGARAPGPRAAQSGRDGARESSGGYALVVMACREGGNSHARGKKRERCAGRSGAPEMKTAGGAATPSRLPPSKT
ncbi:hypothetical protein PT2222_540004 [Paraburkholderia tropica]